MKFLIFDTETTGLPIRSGEYDALEAQSGALPVQYNPTGVRDSRSSPGSSSTRMTSRRRAGASWR